MCGADWLAICWAIENEVDFNGRPARWKKDGYPQAGPMRNSRMVYEEKPDVVVRAPGHSGTADCAGKAMTAGVRVIGVAP